MQYTNTDGIFIIKIERGEDVITTLTNFCKQHTIENASFTGIGAVEQLTCGYYALDEKKYYFKDYDEMVEVVSLTGNVMLKDAEPFIHAHGVFTNTDNVAFGGHIVEMRVGVVLEVMLTPLSSKVERLHNDCIGLYLMDMKRES